MVPIIICEFIDYHKDNGVNKVTIQVPLCSGVYL